MALPIREISAESVRDKGIPQSHISRLHKWWARRPLAASRAVVFASLVPDPDDSRCPEDFRKAVERNLKTHVPGELKHYLRGREVINDPDPYAPYDGIPETLRNRLLMFIAKWSAESIDFESGKRTKSPAPKELLDPRSLVKWETSDPENSQGQRVLQIARELVKVAHGGKTPIVLDPFAGGGAIPLEVGRLGCQAIANDYNPVAYLVLRATCEFPQKYGKPGKRRVVVKEKGKEAEHEIQVENVLVHDVETWANWILDRVWNRFGHLYPSGKDKSLVLAYLWARTVTCSNPSCRGEIPLLRSLLVCNKKGKRRALVINKNEKLKTIEFGITCDKEIERTEGTKRKRGPAVCLFCGQQTSEEEIRKAGSNGEMFHKMVCALVKAKSGKEYRPIEDIDLTAFEESNKYDVECPGETIPEGQWNVKTWLYGMRT